MIPVGDSPRSHTFPSVTYLLILVNFVVFFYELSLSDFDLNQFFFDWGVVPRVFTDYASAPTAPEWDEAARPLTAQFLHGGWLHILGNMLFLWIFGDNVEDAMGHLPYLLFYLASGYIAALAQVYADVDSIIPMVGASGAIAGVMGAYLVLYPRATVTVLVPFLFFLPLVVPALLLIAMWFVTQILSGVAEIGAVGEATGGEGGTAWWAHVGGFVVGLVCGRIIGTPRDARRRDEARTRISSRNRNNA
jgi:membrane associated rhomboid family serine protease